MDRFFNLDTGRIHFTDQGTGDIIVLIHGYLETSEVWDSFARKLAGRFRVINLDLPGHGQSDMLDEIHTMEFMATAISELLENLKVKKAFLCGHSLGGYVTLAFADLFPDKLSGYCLFHSQPFADTPETIARREEEIALVSEGKKDLFYPVNVARMFAPATIKNSPEALLRAKGIAATIHGEAIIAVLKGMIARPSRSSVMESGRIPCLWILGAMDNYINCEAMKTRVSLPENSSLVILKKSGHLGFIEEQGEAIRILTDFVIKTE